jgi:hypothetical protein
VKEVSDVIDNDLYEKLQAYAMTTGQKGGVVREAIICYLAQMGVIEVRSDRFDYNRK